jgi:hypothetical protein
MTLKKTNPSNFSKGKNNRTEKTDPPMPEEFEEFISISIAIRMNPQPFIQSIKNVIKPIKFNNK